MRPSLSSLETPSLPRPSVLTRTLFPRDRRHRHNISAYQFTTEGGTRHADNDDDGESAAGSRLAHLLTLLVRPLSLSKVEETIFFGLEICGGVGWAAATSSTARELTLSFLDRLAGRVERHGRRDALVWRRTSRARSVQGQCVHPSPPSLSLPLRDGLTSSPPPPSLLTQSTRCAYRRSPHSDSYEASDTDSCAQAARDALVDAGFLPDPEDKKGKGGGAKGGKRR